MDPSLSRLLTSLELALDSCQPSADPLREAYGKLLPVLFAAPDPQVVAALTESAWLRGRLGQGDWATVCTPAEMARLHGWMGSVLATYLAPSGTSEEVAPFVESLRHYRSPGLTRMLGSCMRRRTLRAATARTLAHQDTPEAWAVLRQHDGPDLDPELRLQAALHDVTRPRAELSSLLGPQPDRSARYRMLYQAMNHVGSHPDESDLAEAILRCLDDGFEIANVLHTMARKPSPAVRRRLLDRLWPLAQSQAPRLPWPGVDLYRFHDALVHAAPVPDLLAVLLDTLDEPTHTEALFAAIAQRPDPSLVPALSRWSSAHQTRAEQRLVSRALDACRSARPWTT